MVEARFSDVAVFLLKEVEGADLLDRRELAEFLQAVADEYVAALRREIEERRISADAGSA